MRADKRKLFQITPFFKLPRSTLHKNVVGLADRGARPITSSKWPLRQPVDSRMWGTYWHRRAVESCGEVRTSWFDVYRALGGEKPVVGAIRDYNMVAIYTSFW